MKDQDARIANDLERYFRENTGRVLHKWPHYFEIYERHLSRFRGSDVHVVEFGVSHGGSLRMWQQYFGPQATIHGVDVNPHCRALAEDRVSVTIGDQGDRRFLQAFAASIPRIDVLIDDGGHTMQQQIATFEELFPRIAERGVYLCEDTHTSYWRSHGGGYRRPGTFIEYSKNFIDALHAWHAEKGEFEVSDFTRTAHSLHYYDSVLVIEKRPMLPPFHEKTGVETITEFVPAPAEAAPEPASWWRRACRRLSG